MNKNLIFGVILLFSLIGCSNQETAEVEKESKSYATNEEIKSWSYSQLSTIETENGEVSLTGEVGSFGLVVDTFRKETEHTFTWYLWVDDINKQNELIGEKVTINGISEKDKGNELFLAEGIIEPLTQEELLQIPNDNNIVKFLANIKPMRDGKWKLKPFLNEKLLGTSVVIVEGK
ncbi:hypothetical protein LS684_12130 [Cytobacillus spongiae]|uniref:hypothetical protein n=1 Tax=Cytobacillus spongiae TaxID=2901381 RepID=UPI001F43DAF9|nr:hypothetical protein [Cytobacillus spongiae]UII54428.1 hypothetical protein LS684_12130 [Cytobacillus spongiae]